VNSAEFCQALLAGAFALGASFVEASASNISRSGDRAISVGAGGEAVRFTRSCLRRSWTTDVERWLSVETGVEPVRGELLRLAIASGAPLYDFTYGTTMVYRRGDDELLVGETRRLSTRDPRRRRRGARAHRQRSAHSAGDRRGARRRAHGCVQADDPLRRSGPMRAPGWSNVLIANGGGAKGVLFSISVAERIRDLILGVRDASDAFPRYPRSVVRHHCLDCDREYPTGSIHSAMSAAAWSMSTIA